MHCIICEKSTYPIKHPNLETTYHVCSFCGFISKDKTFHLTDNQEFQLYELHENSIDDEKYVAFFESFLQEAVLPFTNKGKEALDFGSGPSPVLAQLMERDYGYDCTIYDKFYAPTTNYHAKKYDLITSTEVMEHIENPLPVFKEFKDLIKDDGIISVMTLFSPNIDENIFGWHYLRDSTHISIFTPKSMNIIAEKIGLEIIYCDNIRYTTFRKK